nr:hypothetical protein DGKKSRWO_DGKKSRWO_CDS_0046 [uncultured phage]CAI9752191.1 hypothetical protein CVNMHQAP_CVNMHQAP_CDS_0046 [uncultured phage]
MSALNKDTQNKCNNVFISSFFIIALVIFLT